MLVFGKVRQFGFLGAVTHGRPQRVDQSHREMIAGSSAGNRSSRPLCASIDYVHIIEKCVNE